MKQLGRVLLVMGLLAVIFVASPVLAKDPLEPHPRVTGVSPVAVVPGSVITLSGENFSYNGVDTMCNTDTIRNGVCPWKSVVAAYKSPRTHSDYSGSQPDFRLTIVSLTTNTIEAKVPDSIPSGDGTYNLGLFLEFDATVAGVSQASQLVGLARYDTITLSGAGERKVVPIASPAAIKPTATIEPVASTQIEVQASPSVTPESNRTPNLGERDFGKTRDHFSSRI